MPELNISNAQDVAKLEGWSIEKAVFDPQVNGIRLRIKHPAAQCLVEFRVWPQLNVSMLGAGLTVSPAMSLRTDDVAGSPADQNKH